MISIDGATKEVYESVRKSTRFTYEEVTANAWQFLSLRRSLGLTRPFVILQIIVMNGTAADLEGFREYWEARGADQVLFKPFDNWAGQMRDVFDGLQVGERQAAMKSPRKYPCKNLWEHMVVAWDGRAVPCCEDYNAEMTLGDLNTQTIREIWNSPAYVALRQAELAGRNNSSLCANCTSAPGHDARPEAVLECFA